MKTSRFFIVFLAFGFILNTYLPAQGGAKFGLKGGLTMAKFSGDDADFFDIDPTIALKFAAGGFVNFDINEQFSIRPEVYYSSKGTKYEQDGDEIIFTMNYIDVPVLAVYNATENFGFYGGPQLSLYLDDGTVEVDGESIDLKDLFGDVFTESAFGLVFGANYYFNQFHIDVRYALGLSSVVDVDDEDVDVKHADIQILLGYTF